jgi:hypothetical protein
MGVTVKSLNRTGKSDHLLADNEDLGHAELLADNEAEAKRAMAAKLEEHAAQVGQQAGRQMGGLAPAGCRQGAVKERC